MDAVLEGLKGVKDAKASFFTKLARVEYDPEQISPEQMVEALNSQTAYRASLPAPPPARLRLKVDGLVKPGQVFQLRWVLTRLEGVLDVDLRLGEATIDYEPARVSSKDVRAVFERIGLRASFAGSKASAPEVKVLALRLLGLKGPRDIFMPGQILSMIPGLLDVDFKPDRRMHIQYDARKVTQDTLIGLLKQMGLEPAILSPKDRIRGASAWFRARVDGLRRPEENVVVGFRLFVQRGILDIRLKPGRVEVQYDPKRTSREVLLTLLKEMKLSPTPLPP